MGNSRLKEIEMQKVHIVLVTITLFVLLGCSRNVYVQDNNGKPISGVKVTLSSGEVSNISYTDKSGYAKLDSELAKKEGTIKYEKEGHQTESYRYPGNISLIENLEVSNNERQEL
jgi:hypothetical protein